MSQKSLKQKQNNKIMGSSSIMLDDPDCVVLDKTGKSIAYFCKRKPVRVDRDLIKGLKRISAKMGNKNVRLCLHEDSRSPFHDMIILERENKYYRAHRHLTKGESFHIIDGRLAIFVFDDDGTIMDGCVLSKENTFIYRVGINMYHAVMPLSGIVIYHESKIGPFLGAADSIYPEWAPSGDDICKVEEYKKNLLTFLSREKA